MNWMWMTLLSALALGVYDVAKKLALRKNSVLWVLFCATLLSTVFLTPLFRQGPLQDHLRMAFKAVLVTSSWVSGLAAMKTIPLTTLSTIKATRPMFVVLFSVAVFGERLDAVQWVGVVIVLGAIFLLSRSSAAEGISFSRSRGVLYAVISVFAGVGSALYDKHILRSLDPLFVQCWANLYVTILLGACLAVSRLLSKRRGESFRPLHPDWMLIVIAALITAADMLYFFALKQDGALLSIVSLERRTSVVVTFVLGAIVFKEKKLKGKAVSLCLLLAGLFALLSA